MLRQTLAVATSTLVLFAAAAASAQPATPAPRSSLGEQGQMIIGAEHLVTLFAFESTKVTETDTPAGTNQTITTTVSASQTSTSILGSNPGGPGGGLTTFYKIPRLGFDYVIVPNVTIGGSAMLLFTLGSGETNRRDANGMTTTNTSDGTALTLFGLAPRGGYIIALNEMFAIWPRAGFSYYSAKVRGAPDPAAQVPTYSSDTITQWALDAEGLFVFTPFPHVGLTAGLALDIPLTGSASHDDVVGSKTTTTNRDASLWHLGINLGSVLYF